jgi:quinol-cytochrome oxidoreductase complex cytochrome b subunit
VRGEDVLVEAEQRVVVAEEEEEDVVVVEVEQRVVAAEEEEEEEEEEDVVVVVAAAGVAKTALSSFLFLFYFIYLIFFPPKAGEINRYSLPLDPVPSLPPFYRYCTYLSCYKPLSPFQPTHMSLPDPFPSILPKVFVNMLTRLNCPGGKKGEAGVGKKPFLHSNFAY